MRAQICEHVDWRVWRIWFQRGDGSDRVQDNVQLESNDYRLLVAQAEVGEGALLGWHHLVHRQVQQGVLVRPVQEALVFRDRYHHLATHKNARMRPEYPECRAWPDEEINAMMSGWQGVEVESGQRLVQGA